MYLKTNWRSCTAFVGEEHFNNGIMTFCNNILIDYLMLVSYDELFDCNIFTQCIDILFH